MTRWTWPPTLMLAYGLVSGVASDPPRSSTFGQISPRLQWKESGGYCGEASIQTAALRYGVWVSQGEVRRLAGGEVLLGENADRALRRLHFTFQSWDPNGRPKPRLPAFLTWLKQQLRNGHPCLVGVYIAGGSHREYDHILPVVGLVSGQPDAESPSNGDQFILHTLFTPGAVRRKTSDLGATRNQCQASLFEGGNIPENTPYGIAITGIAAHLRSQLPVQLTVDRPDEPNPYLRQAPCGLHGIVSVAGLEQGKRYVLHRIDVPHGASFRKGVPITRCSFWATASSWVWEDPDPIPSDGTTYFRCFPALRDEP